jgi:cyclopropane fatty-acyl-phospholipid synthase-like methyltransferase
MAEKLPLSGTILDIGCGHGLFCIAAALQSPTRKILGLDHDANRVHLGTEIQKYFPNITLQFGNMSHLPMSSQGYAAIVAIDVMHYFNPQTQELILKQLFALLPSQGRLLIRDVNPDAGFISVWNKFYEKIATFIKFTQSEQKTLYFRTPSEWEALLKTIGFRVQSERCSSFLFSDILYVCDRP